MSTVWLNLRTRVRILISARIRNSQCSSLFSCLTKKIKKKKIKKKEKFHTLSLNTIWSIEMKFNTIFMYDTYTYDMNNYDIKYNVEFVMLIIKYKNFPWNFIRKSLKIWHAFWHFGTSSWKFGTPCGTLTRLFARWHVKMRNWHAFM